MKLVTVLLTLTVISALNAAEIASTQRFEFRSPQAMSYRLLPQVAARISQNDGDWLTASIEDGSTNVVAFGSRIVLQLQSPEDLKHLTAGSSLTLTLTVQSNLFILQAPDALTALREAARLAGLPEVTAAYPVMQRESGQHGTYAARGTDPFAIPFFFTSLGQTIESQWPIENRDGNSARRGLDLNIMGAWSYSRGEEVTVAVSDGGVELTHPELTNRVTGAPHYNFDLQNTNANPRGGASGDPLVAFWTHATAVAGLIAAEGDNGRGMIGVAPKAKIASWVVHLTNSFLVSDDRLMDMYQYASNIVAVQNHSWGAGNGLRQQRGPTLLEQVGIENAVTQGRNGLGAIMVRSAGNDRNIAASANDDGYLNDPRVITVGAVSQGGRVTAYSERGACILLGAPGGGDNGQGLLTLDLVGHEKGINAGVIYPGDLSDYIFGVQGFTGTSAAAPLVSGIAALLLSTNPNLGFRDVQHLLALSARHWDLADPDLSTNGAGLRVSHNLGFGVPNAGHAAELARTWTNRPALVTLAFTNESTAGIPDAGLRIEVTGEEIPGPLSSIVAFPTFAPAQDQPTPALRLVDVGTAITVPAVNLTNKGALILRGGGASFGTKLNNVAQAGAAFAIIYNSTNGGGFNFSLIADTSFSIPSGFVGNSTGENLKALMATNASALARLALLSTNQVFTVTNTLLCEQIGVRVQTDHPVRGDLRITVRSPQGTRSVLQQINDDTTAGSTNWTHWTTHHFLESSAGEWTVSVADQLSGNTGSVKRVTLILRGTQITDTDRDGLDDNWETTRLTSLAYGPKDDPDRDGRSNALEQMAGSDSQGFGLAATPDLSRWGLFGSDLMRISWPSAPQYQYQVWGGSNVAALTLISNVAGVFPEGECFVPYSSTTPAFYQVRAFQAP
jgi:subtilisin family serine protease